MNKTLNHKSISIISGILMFVVLSWLTLSLPVVNKARQSVQLTENLVNNDNPFAGTTEEKTPNSSSSGISEEYMHHSDHDFSLKFFRLALSHIHSQESTYLAYHGEPMCPPPNALS